MAGDRANGRSYCPTTSTGTGNRRPHFPRQQVQVQLQFQPRLSSAFPCAVVHLSTARRRQRRKNLHTSLIAPPPASAQFIVCGIRPHSRSCAPRRPCSSTGRKYTQSRRRGGSHPAPTTHTRTPRKARCMRAGEGSLDLRERELVARWI